MARNDEGKQLQYLSTPLEKRNAQLLAGIFQGQRKIEWSPDGKRLDARQRKAIVDAFLRARRVWNPNALEKLATAAADAKHLRQRGAPHLGNRVFEVALTTALAGEQFAMVLQMIGDTLEYREAFKAAWEALSEINQLLETLQEIKATIEWDFDRKPALAMMQGRQCLHVAPRSKRARSLQAQAWLYLHILLGNYDQALPFARQLREETNPSWTIPMLQAHFQAATLSVILGDIETAKHDLHRLMSIEAEGHEFEAVKLSEHIIVSLVIALETGESAIGIQAIALLCNRWRPIEDGDAIRYNRRCIMLAHAMRFAVENMLPDVMETILVTQQLALKRDLQHLGWASFAEVCHYFLHFDAGKLAIACRRLKRWTYTPASLLLLKLVEEYLNVDPHSFAREATLLKFFPLAQNLPAKELARFDLPWIIQLKLGSELTSRQHGGDFLVASSQS